MKECDKKHHDMIISWSNNKHDHHNNHPFFSHVIDTESLSFGFTRSASAAKHHFGILRHLFHHLSFGSGARRSHGCLHHLGVFQHILGTQRRGYNLGVQLGLLIPISWDIPLVTMFFFLPLIPSYNWNYTCKNRKYPMVTSQICVLKHGL